MRRKAFFSSALVRRQLGPALLVALPIVGMGLWLAMKKPPDLVQGMADADAVNVSAKIAARVARLHVREGDRVTAGQVLFQLDSPEVAARQQQADAVLAAARAQAAKAEEGARQEEIRAAEAQWKRAETAAQLAESTARRIENLHREGVVSLQRRDEAVAQQQSARQAAVAARAQYELALSATRRQDKQTAQARVRQAEGGVAEVAAAEAETVGRSPIAGEVNKRLASVGELVPAGYPVFTLVDIDHLWVAFHLREDQFAALKPGQRLKGTIPALGDQTAEFEVYFINPAGEYATWRATRQSAGYDVKSFEVRARPLARLAGFRPGMSVLFAWPQN